MNIEGPDTTVAPYMGEANNVQNINNKQKKLNFGFGETDTMTLEQSDLVSKTTPTKTHIQIDNGGVVTMEGGGTIDILPTLKISNCLYVPSLSHKFLYISHMTKV